MEKMYKNFKIKVGTEGIFEALEQIFEDGKFSHYDGPVASAPSLIELKAKLDKISKAKYNIPCFVQRCYSPPEFERGKITSKYDCKYGREYRVQFSDSSWNKIEEHRLFKDTPKNREIADKLTFNYNEIKRLEKENDELRNSFEKFSREEVP